MNRKPSHFTLIPTALILGAVAVSSPFVMAQEIRPVSFEELPNRETYGDFVVGPGKVELFMKPGEERTVEVKVSNRLGVDRVFNLATEDFTGSPTLDQTVLLLGDERGPYSLRDFISVAATEVMIKHGERAVVPVRVKIPEDAEPGGKYGSVLVSTASLPDEQQYAGGAGAGAAIISRIGVLFFVRVAGEVVESGNLFSFETRGKKRLYSQGPVTFDILFENKGSVHINPYGRLSIYNVAGQLVGEKIIDPWFVMPGTKRLREIVWDRPLLFGRYTATLEINRGYNDIVDEASLVLWFVPLKLIGMILGGLIILILSVRFLFSRIEIRFK